MSQCQKHALNEGAPFAELTPAVIAWTVFPLPNPQCLGHHHRDISMLAPPSPFPHDSKARQGKKHRLDLNIAIVKQHKSDNIKADPLSAHQQVALLLHQIQHTLRKSVARLHQPGMACGGLSWNGNAKVTSSHRTTARA
jgi:hypothetical protein